MSISRAQVQKIGLIAGPVLALLLSIVLPAQYSGPTGEMVPFTMAARMALGVMAWMAVWWLTEAVEISTTALIPLAVFPLLGVTSIKEAAAPYAHPLIFLYLGGFIIALSMQRWGLDRRIALRILGMVGTKPANMIGGFMLTTAFLSAFISNTATTAMMLPIALSVVTLLNSQQSNTGQQNQHGGGFGTALMLGIAYSASIGGIATIVGTPPNALLVGFAADSIADEHQMEISFASWLVVGLPVTLTMLPVAWLLLTRFLFPMKTSNVEGGQGLIRVELEKLGAMKRPEWVTLIVFGLTGLFWILRPFISGWSLELGGQARSPFAGLSDTVIAMIAAVLLFTIPSGKGKGFTMDWKTTSKLPWDILILFGGGMSLASAVKATGVAEFIGSQATIFAGVPSPVLILVITASVILLTELTSNIATTATLLPILAALAGPLGVDPYLLIIPATIAASCAFMMPVATPPNAIVFGSRQISLPQMMKAGMWLNAAGIILIPIIVSLTLRFLVK